MLTHYSCHSPVYLIHQLESVFELIFNQFFHTILSKGLVEIFYNLSHWVGQVVDHLSIHMHV